MFLHIVVGILSMLCVSCADTSSAGGEDVSITAVARLNYDTMVDQQLMEVLVSGLEDKYFQKTIFKLL